MTEAEQQQTQKKRKYSKPEASRMSLRPEEAVLGHCKTGGVAGPGGATSCTPVGPCFTQGS